MGIYESVSKAGDIRRIRFWIYRPGRILRGTIAPISLAGRSSRTEQVLFYTRGADQKPNQLIREPGPYAFTLTVTQAEGESTGWLGRAKPAKPISVSFERALPYYDARAFNEGTIFMHAKDWNSSFEPMTLRLGSLQAPCHPFAMEEVDARPDDDSRARERPHVGNVGKDGVAEGDHRQELEVEEGGDRRGGREPVGVNEEIVPRATENAEPPASNTQERTSGGTVQSAIAKGARSACPQTSNRRASPEADRRSPCNASAG